MQIYQPAEDSYLLQKHVRLYAEGRVLDVGTGSGIQALTAITCPNVREVVAVDINQDAIETVREKIKEQKLRKIRVLQSNLFEYVEGQFSLIIFNPPYLPQDKGIDDAALYGGKKGWEISERFLAEVSQFLLPDGKILFLFSSLTNKDKINEIITQNLLKYTQVDQQKLAFEELYVYEIVKSALLRELEANLLENIHYFTQGRRGVIYTATFDRSKWIKTHFAKKELIKVAIKTKKKESEAEGRIANEAEWLKILNKKGIGPKLLFSGENYLVYQFVEGEFILDWIAKNTKQDVIKVLHDVLDQCFVMDLLGVNKEEMHHPLKHVIIDKNNQSTLLDFERCYKTDKPHNVTQFVDFICRIQADLKKKGIIINVEELRELAREYKDVYTKEVLKSIKQVLQA